MQYALGLPHNSSEWQEYFDVVICSASKPNFYNSRYILSRTVYIHMHLYIRLKLNNNLLLMQTQIIYTSLSHSLSIYIYAYIYTDTLR